MDDYSRLVTEVNTKKGDVVIFCEAWCATTQATSWLFAALAHAADERVAACPAARARFAGDAFVVSVHDAVRRLLRLAVRDGVGHAAGVVVSRVVLRLSRRALPYIMKQKDEYVVFWVGL